MHKMGMQAFSYLQNRYRPQNADLTRISLTRVDEGVYTNGIVPVEKGLIRCDGLRAIDNVPDFIVEVDARAVVHDKLIMSGHVAAYAAIAWRLS